MVGDRNHKRACAHAFSEVPETCPAVERALKLIVDQTMHALRRHAGGLDSDVTDGLREEIWGSVEEAEKKIKRETMALRAAYVKAQEQVFELQDEVDDLQGQVGRLEEQIESQGSD